jgi:hypothetical protein
MSIIRRDANRRLAIQFEGRDRNTISVKMLLLPIELTLVKAI